MTIVIVDSLLYALLVGWHNTCPIITGRTLLSADWIGKDSVVTHFSKNKFYRRVIFIVRQYVKESTAVNEGYCRF